MIRFHILIEARNFAGIQLLLAPKLMILIINEIGAWGLSRQNPIYAVLHHAHSQNSLVGVSQSEPYLRPNPNRRRDSFQVPFHVLPLLCLPNDSAYTEYNDHYFIPNLRHIKFYAVQGYNTNRSCFFH